MGWGDGEENRHRRGHAERRRTSRISARRLPRGRGIGGWVGGTVKRTVTVVVTPNVVVRRASANTRVLAGGVGGVVRRASVHAVRQGGGMVVGWGDGGSPWW